MCISELHIINHLIILVINDIELKTTLLVLCSELSVMEEAADDDG